MNAVFLKLLNMSITASWLILAAIAVRFLLKKAPKWISCLLWAIVAIKLICPFSIESTFSLIPGSEPVPMDIEIMATPSVDIGIPVLNEPVNKAISQNFAPKPENSVNPMQITVYILARIWIVGTACMIVYAVISFLRIKKTVSVSMELSKGVKACDDIRSPFILGMFKPIIYVPSSLKKEMLDPVLKHEKAHLLRKDHWWKPVGFLLLSVYWFNPFCWIAYILLCRDIEAACDEKVIRDMGKEEVAAYSQTLLDCNFSRKTIAACPLAFGEVGVKSRIKEILNYKKPAFWVVCAAIVVCVVVGIFFLTNPRKDSSGDESVAVDMKEPPTLTVTCDGSSIDVGYGTASWYYVDENGKGFGMESDGPHPLFCQCPDIAIPSENSSVIISFPINPDNIEIHYWPDKYMNDESAYDKYSNAEYDSNSGKITIPMNEGLVIEVIGEWEYGNVCYCFHSQPPETVIHLTPGSENDSDSNPGAATMTPVVSALWDSFGFDCYPVENGYMIKDWSEDAPYWEFHVDKGSAIYAVKDGNAVGADNAEYGNYVELIPDNTTISVIRYCFLKERFMADSPFDAVFVNAGTELSASGVTDDTLRIYVGTSNTIKVIESVDKIERDFEYGNSKGKLCAYFNHGVYTDGRIETVDIILEDSDKHAVWTTMIGTPHVGWDAYYYYRENDTDYLIEYYPNTSQGMIAYSFKMFSIDESGQENVVHEFYAYSSEEIEDFNNAVSPYMDNAVLFVSTINGVIHTGQ